MLRLDLKKLNDLSGVALEGVQELMLSECAPVCLAQVPAHIESLRFSTPYSSKPEEPLEVRLPRDGALKVLELSTSPSRPVRFLSLPGGLSELRVTGRVDPAELPPTLEKLSLWSCELPQPLKVTLPGLKRLMVYLGFASDKRLTVEALPPALEELSIWSCTVERLPEPLPPLQELSFDSADLRAVRWSKVPETLARLSCVRCELREPVALPKLPKLTSASFYACNFTDAVRLLEQPALTLVHLACAPLSPESDKALAAARKRGVETMLSKKADLELTRRLYAAGINLSAETEGRKKIRLHHPLASVVESMPTEQVLGLVEQVEKGELKLSGKAFIDELRRQSYEAKKAAREARKAAK